jgi:membrane protein CcdC involved in cytochrome C biogenesis
MNLAIIEYIELLFYRDRARSSIMFPKVSLHLTNVVTDNQLKAMFCLLSYTVVVPGREPLYVSPISKSSSSRWTDISREQSN